LRSSEKYSRRPELLQAHPIFPRLLTLKQSLATLEDLDFAISDSEEDDANEDGESMDADEFLGDAKKLWKYDRKKGLDPGELEELIKEATLLPRRAKHDEQTLERPKKKRKTTQVEPELPVSDFTEPELPPLKMPSSRVQPDSENMDAYGEATSLHYADAADKSARKKSLRFHTSKIESASMRRQGARNKAVGGDDDLPYKERKKEKEARLVREAKVNGRGQGGEDLEDNPDGPTDDRNSRIDGDDTSDEDSGGQGADGYYELVKQTAKLKKEQKKKDYEVTRSVEQ
jgi:U3 small nucleolar RNA-associated protein 3